MLWCDTWRCPATTTCLCRPRVLIDVPQPAIEIINALNCSVFTQQQSQWQTSPQPPGPTTPQAFLLSLNASNTDLSTGCSFRFTSPPLPFAPNW